MFIVEQDREATFYWTNEKNYVIFNICDLPHTDF